MALFLPAFTLIELLVTLSLSALLLILSRPMFSQINAYHELSYEANAVKHFLEGHIYRAQQSSNDFTLSTSTQNHRWCLVFVEQWPNTPARAVRSCDCFTPETCRHFRSFKIYQPKFEHILFNQRRKLFMEINSETQEVKNSCFRLSHIHNESIENVISINENGFTKIEKKQGSRSECFK